MIYLIIGFTSGRMWNFLVKPHNKTSSPCFVDENVIIGLYSQDRCSSAQSWYLQQGCVFVPTDNVFEVSLVKNTSGLGFSFSRDEHVPDEPHGSSMVRVKKLFPGQPAAESGRIKVGDVILQVNQTHLKGLSQHVCYSCCFFRKL